MKKSILSVIAAVLLSGLGGCDFLMGPDSPAGNGGGNLTISFGAGGAGNERAISSGADLPADVLAALRYELVLTGPGGEALEKTVSGGESLSLTAALGEWRIEAKAYRQGALAGTGSLSFTVAQGINSVRVPMMINGGYFDIIPDPSPSGGTVEANFRAAFPGTTVTLTVTPDSGYMLKDGSPVYNDGSDHAIAGPPYTFTMPASDVTVSAAFEPSFDITIEGPQDKTIVISAAHSGNREPATTISWSAGEWLAFTVENSGYSAEAGNLLWFVEGEEKTGTESSLTIHAKDYVKRTYRLTVMIKADDQWYSTDTVFRVVE